MICISILILHFQYFYSYFYYFLKDKKKVKKIFWEELSRFLDSHDFDPVTWEALHTRFAAEDNQLTTYEHPD